MYVLAALHCCCGSRLTRLPAPVKLACARASDQPAHQQRVGLRRRRGTPCSTRRSSGPRRPGAAARPHPLPATQALLVLWDSGGLPKCRAEAAAGRAVASRGRDRVAASAERAPGTPGTGHGGRRRRGSTMRWSRLGPGRSGPRPCAPCCGRECRAGLPRRRRRLRLRPCRAGRDRATACIRGRRGRAGSDISPPLPVRPGTARSAPAGAPAPWLI